MMRSLVLTSLLIGACAMTAQSEAREWTDSTGTFKVEAELVDVTEDAVRLKKSDGVIVDVPLDRLSEADRLYLRSLTPGTSAKNQPRPKTQSKSLAEAIEAAFEDPVTVEFVKTPLRDVVAYLCDYARIPIRLDQRAMDDVGIGSDTAITLAFRGNLDAALDAMLDPLDLTWTVWNEVLLITTPAEAESQVEPRVYRLRKRLNVDQLIADITGKIEPDNWSRVGGYGSIEFLPQDILVIAQIYRTHRLIAHHYGDLIEPIRPSERFPIHCQIATRLKDALFQPTQIDFIETPLADVAAFLKDRHRIAITVDENALQDVGIGVDVPITMALKGVQLKSGLAFLLRPLDLAWGAGKEEIRITTPEAAEARPELVSYRVDDLITRQQADAMVELITSTVAPTTWNGVGGPGSVGFGVRGTLDVRQSFHIHMQLSRLLEDMRHARRRR